MTDNLLVDPVFRVRARTGMVQASLPGVLALLGQDEVVDFPGLRPHHRHPWHAFLCQLAVMALEEAGHDDVPEGLCEEDWRRLIRGLTPGYPDDAPWRLVVDDLAKPAFLQPPVPEGTLKDFKGMADSDHTSPLGLDVLVTSKAHGEKDKSFFENAMEDWALGLLMLQSFSGFLGQGNYGIARQNGGFAARPGVSLLFSQHPGENWLRDCRILLASRETWQKSELFHPLAGKRLLWLEPWRGGKEEALSLAELHPLFIEICRRVRLFSPCDEMLAFCAKGTSAARVDGKPFNGVLGDPWIPVNSSGKEVKAYNLAPHYSVAHQVLFDRQSYTPSLLQCFHPSDPPGEASVAFRVFSRTQGGSAGYHERFIPIPRKSRRFCQERRDDAAAVAKAMAGLADDARKRVLRPAVLQLLQAARDAPEFKQPETAQWAVTSFQALDRAVDEHFFPFLWDCLDALGDSPVEPAILQPWSQFLIQRVRSEFKRACNALPTSSALRYRAMAKAENLLEGSLRKNLVIKEAL
ncbi:MAG TPA: type I-E CRISPR-associated protein Cse1/CasA [Solidesulfovibrio magneticus]|nr:type I-E CRISPR-associated protein Cse1/CasA [Solidesulfovibrio magneticus]